MTYEFGVALQELKEERTFEATHGVFVRCKDAYAKRFTGSRESYTTGPINVLMVYIKEQGLRAWDLFSQFDKNGDLKISREEFVKGIKDNQVPLTDQEINKLMDSMDLNKDGFIDYRYA